MNSSIGGTVLPKIGGTTIGGSGYSSGWSNSYTFKNDPTEYKTGKVETAKVEIYSLDDSFDNTSTSARGINTNAAMFTTPTHSIGASSYVLKDVKGFEEFDDTLFEGINKFLAKFKLKLENLVKPATIKVEPVYSSWFGIQNEAMWNLLGDWVGKGLEALPNSLLKKITKKYNDDHDDYGKFGTGSGKLGEFFDSINETNAALQEDLAYVKGYDKDYQLGKKQKLKNINIKVLSTNWNGASLFDTGEGVAETAVGTFSGRVRVGYVDAAASVSVGPGHIGADACATVGLFKAEGKYSSPRLKTESGLELLSCDANGSVSVCEATVKGKALIGGYWEKGPDGKRVRHLEAGISLQAEANLFKATASGQVNVFGIGLAGEATFKVGLGAKLDAGFDNGKLHFKIGLAAGIGFEFGFSIDLGGFVENIKVLLADVKDVILQTVDDVVAWGKNIYDAGKQWVEDRWEDIKVGAGYVWDGIQWVGEGIADVAVDVAGWDIWIWNWF